MSTQGGRWSKTAKNLSTYFVNLPFMLSFSKKIKTEHFITGLILLIVDNQYLRNTPARKLDFFGLADPC